MISFFTNDLFGGKNYTAAAAAVMNSTLLMSVNNARGRADAVSATSGHPQCSVTYSNSLRTRTLAQLLMTPVYMHG